MQLRAIALATLLLACGSSSDADSTAADPAATPGDPVVGAPSGPAPAPGAKPPASAPPPGQPAPPGKTDLYVSTFGDPKNPAVVFLHGGPGASAIGFELSAAPKLADQGYFVVAYDQRGSGRSPKGAAADYSYAGMAHDLDGIIATFGLVRPVLMGHSFGGTIALHYLELRPGVARGAILVASPMDFPSIYETSLEECEQRYMWTARFDKADAMRTLRAKMFPNGLVGPFTYGIDDIGTVFQAMEDARIDYTPVPTPDDVAFAAKLVMTPNAASLATANPEVGAGFEANEHVGEQSFLPLLAKHTAEVRAIYAARLDLMFSAAQMDAIRANVADMRTIEGASHFVYVDQTDAFVAAAARDLHMMN
jgi:proline iminopeptidase